MILSIGVIMFGLLNIIIWRLMKNYSIVKAKIIKKSYFLSKDSYLKKYKNFIIEYTFKDREYKSRVTIYPESPIYNRTNIRRRMRCIHIKYIS